MHTSRKILCTAVVIVLVIAMSACAASNPTGPQLGAATTAATTQPVPSSSTVHAEFPEPEVPYFDISLMPDARKNEINSRWNQKFIVALDWEEDYAFHCRFYGDFGNCVVILTPGAWPVEWSVTVAGYTFTYASSFVLYVYANGDFCDMQQAYENGLLTQEQIGMVHAYHESCGPEQVPDYPRPPSITEPTIPPYPFEEGFDPEALLAKIPADVQLQIKQALIDQFGQDDQPVNAERVQLEVFGIFDQVYAVRRVGVFMGMDALETELVNGLRFTYSGSAARLYIYYDGYWYRLQEAFDAQIISGADLLAVYENYYSAYPYLWGY